MNSKRRAAYLLLVFGSILLLVAAWNLPDKPASQIEGLGVLSGSNGR